MKNCVQSLIILRQYSSQQNISFQCRGSICPSAACEVRPSHPHRRGLPWVILSTDEISDIAGRSKMPLDWATVCLASEILNVEEPGQLVKGLCLNLETEYSKVQVLMSMVEFESTCDLIYVLQDCWVPRLSASRAICQRSTTRGTS